MLFQFVKFIYIFSGYVHLIFRVSEAIKTTSMIPVIKLMDIRSLNTQLTYIKKRNYKNSAQNRTGTEKRANDISLGFREVLSRHQLISTTEQTTDLPCATPRVDTRLDSEADARSPLPKLLGDLVAPLAGCGGVHGK